MDGRAGMGGRDGKTSLSGMIRTGVIIRDGMIRDGKTSLSKTRSSVSISLDTNPAVAVTLT